MEAIKNEIPKCEGCGATGPDVVWTHENWCEDCEHRTFNGGDDDDFQSCDDCDRPDACSDFGCAIKQGLHEPNNY